MNHYGITGKVEPPSGQMNDCRLVKHSDTNHCSSCPSTKKHRILRMMCSNPDLFSPGLKRALVNGPDSAKDVKSLVPSLGKIEKKSNFGKVLLMLKKESPFNQN